MSSTSTPFLVLVTAAIMYSQSNLEKTKSFKSATATTKLRDRSDDKAVYTQAQMAAKYATLTKPRRIIEWED